MEGGTGPTEVVKSVEDDIELLEPFCIVFGFLDVPMDRRNFHVGVKGSGCLCCNLLLDEIAPHTRG